MAKQIGNEKTRRQVLLLRDEGLSFSEIAKELGISKSYAVKLVKAPHKPGPAPRRERSHSTALTVQQRHFATGLLEGKSKRQAAIDAGVPPGGADSYAQRVMNNGRFQESFRDLLARKGLSEERIAETHAANLEAKKVVAVATQNGKVTDVVEHPDYAVRQRAADSAWELYGRKKEETTGEFKAVHAIMPMEMAIVIAQLRGDPEAVVKRLEELAAQGVEKIHSEELFSLVAYYRHWGQGTALGSGPDPASTPPKGAVLPSQECAALEPSGCLRK